MDTAGAPVRGRFRPGARDRERPPPDGYDSWKAYDAEHGVPEDQAGYAIVDAIGGDLQAAIDGFAAGALGDWAFRAASGFRGLAKPAPVRVRPRQAAPARADR